MLNEFTYCPRLFYYEHVEGLFEHNRETIEGALGHSARGPTAGRSAAAGAVGGSRPAVRARSVTLSSDTYGVIAKLDLLESDGAQVTPVDYKRGRPCEAADGSIEAWDTDQIQLAVQALILRDQGYDCREAIVYYAATRQRIRIAIDDALLRRTLEVIQQAAAAAAGDRIPPPLADSPKCPRCSLVGICLPDETNLCLDAGHGHSTAHVQKTLVRTSAPRARPSSIPRPSSLILHRLKSAGWSRPATTCGRCT